MKLRLKKSTKRKILDIFTRAIFVVVLSSLLTVVVDVLKAPDSVSQTTTQEFLELVKPEIQKTLDKEDTATFSKPVVTHTDVFTTMTGHFVKSSQKTSPVDSAYTSAFVRVGESQWKLVHLAINGKIIIHTLQ